MADALHFNLDDAWDSPRVAIPSLDLRDWGPQLRFSAPPRLIEKFFAEISPRLAPFTLFGSGDFHHLSALWLRQVREAFTLVSFDNHPDWDVRPPKWACGGWINRALDLPLVQRVAVWGCGNFECWWPHQFFGNRRAERSGRLAVHPWGEDRPPRRGAILRENWRVHFEQFAMQLTGRAVYVTIDLDCLRAEDAVTNWENGRFELEDVAWALLQLRTHARIVAGDICGAYSKPTYARWKQRFAAEFDHPKRDLPNEATAREINHRALQKLWPLLAN